MSDYKHYPVEYRRLFAEKRNGCYIARISRRHYELYKAYLASIYCGLATPHGMGTSDHVRLLCVFEIVGTKPI
jgi:hypothetical protein